MGHRPKLKSKEEVELNHPVLNNIDDQITEKESFKESTADLNSPASIWGKTRAAAVSNQKFFSTQDSPIGLGSLLDPSRLLLNAKKRALEKIMNHNDGLWHLSESEAG